MSTSSQVRTNIRYDHNTRKATILLNVFDDWSSKYLIGTLQAFDNNFRCRNRICQGKIFLIDNFSSKVCNATLHSW